VFLERAVVAEGVMPGRGLFGEEAVETACGAVARDGGMRAAAVPRVVLRLEVAASPAYTAPFVGGGIAGAGVCVMREKETSFALTVLNVRCSELYGARFPKHIAWDP